MSMADGIFRSEGRDNLSEVTQFDCITRLYLILVIFTQLIAYFCTKDLGSARAAGRKSLNRSAHFWACLLL